MIPSTPMLLDRVRKIAVLRPNAVGDFAFALPALHALRNAYPYAEMTYIGKPWHAEFLAGRPGPVDRVVLIPPCPGVGAPPDARAAPEPIEAFVAAMRAAEFDLAVQIYGGGRYSNPFLQRLGARLNIGMKAADAPPLERWVSYGERQNRRLQMLEVVALVGASTLPLGPELQVTERDRREAAPILAALSGKPLVVVQPGASDRRRRWPPARFAAVADALAQAGAVIAVNGTADEAPLVRATLEAMHHAAFDLGGRLSLAGLCGLIERAALVVANDTGPLHLAAAIGTPSVGIYWLSNLLESGPLRQDRHRAALSARIHCPVCGAENVRRRCPHDESFVADIGVGEVTALAFELFNLGSPG